MRASPQSSPSPFGDSLVYGAVVSLGDLLFPDMCVCCGCRMVQGEHTMCSLCRYRMPFTGHYNSFENDFSRLFSGRVGFRTGSALMYFRRGSDYRSMLHRMKYGGRADVARVLGEIYGLHLLRSGHYAGVDLVVPVPLHWSRRVGRGYNQSAEFARGIARSLGVVCEFGAVVRVRRTRTQARLRSLGDRINNVSEAFSLRRPERLLGRGVLLVDDIVTTGSTMDQCASVINSQLPGVSLYLGAIAMVSDL